ncbi:hypothetical protein ACOTVT_03550 [Aliarcobacter butzleri]
MPKCKVCEQEDNEIKFIKEGTWCGTKKKPSEFFRKSEFDFGWDYYADFDLKEITCKCGYVWYEKV